jgi:hypothetical protein
MARIRSVKPEFFTSLTISGLSERARLAFIGIWTYVDDYGRAVDDPRLVKAAVFPMDDKITAKVVGDVLNELAASGRIIRYEAGGRRYFVVANWTEHQKIDRKTGSKLPPPPGEPSTNGHHTCSEGSSRMQRGRVEGSIHDQGAGSREQGKDQGDGSGSRESQVDLSAAAARCCESPAAAAAVETIVSIRERQHEGRILHPGPWRSSMRTKIADEFADRIASYLDAHPDADAETILTAGCGFDRWDVIGAGAAS